MNNQEMNCMDCEELKKAIRAMAKVFQQMALKGVKKREKQELKKVMLTPADKWKRAHDDFHKFVRSL